MIVGINVGGTHTDGVLVAQKAADSTADNYKIIATTKVITEQDNLMNSILKALDNLIKESNAEQIERLVLSTTLTTNAILEEKYDPVGLILIPGPGINPDYLKYGEENLVLSGYVNHRGQQVKKIEQSEIKTGLKSFVEKSIKNIAVVGKFSIRNPEQELAVLAYLKAAENKFTSLTAGHRLSGRLNFPRRIVTAYFNSAVTKIHQEFSAAIKQALQKRRLEPELFLLKCDGGTIPLADSLELPVETVNSGPAASIMGVMTLSNIDQRQKTAVSLDIGGTTTDIGLFIQGEPVFMPDGIVINDLATLIRGLYSISIPIGGDSLIQVIKGELKIGPRRLGPAAAAGGPAPTPTDALLVAGYLAEAESYDKKFDLKKAETALSSLVKQLQTANNSKNILPTAEKLTVHSLAELIIDQLTDKIVNRIRKMLADLEDKTVYTISELLAEVKIEPELLLGMGGPAKALVKLLAQKLNYQAELIPYSKVANAVGAAFARPTITTTVRIDTAAGQLDIAEAGIHRSLKASEKFNLEQSKKLALKITKERSLVKTAVEITDVESFNVIEGFRTVGAIREIKAQVKPGPITRLKGDGQDE